MVKLLENTFRAVNIGLVNEMALMCERLGIDVWEVVDAAATKPFGFMPFYPGPGLGGHCIPIDPFYLSWKAQAERIRARASSSWPATSTRAMPQHVVGKVADALNERAQGAQGLARSWSLGIAYKRDVDDMRESPALDVMGLLHEKGAEVSYSDPFVPSLEGRQWPGGADLASVSLTPAALASVDCVAILTEHRTFDYDMIVANARLIVDTRNAIKRIHPHVFRLGAKRVAEAAFV